MRGVTLTELLISISILVTLGLVILLNLFSYQQRQTLELEARKIVISLRATQTKSLAGVDGDGDDRPDCWGIHFVNSQKDFYQVFFGENFTASNVTDTYFLKPQLEFSQPSEGKTVDIIFESITGLPKNLSVVKVRLIKKPQDEISITIHQNGKIEY